MASTTVALKPVLTDWAFEDRIAALLMTIIYTSDHIDVAMLIPSNMPKGGFKGAKNQALGPGRLFKTQSKTAAQRKQEVLEGLKKPSQYFKLDQEVIFRVHDIPPTVFNVDKDAQDFKAPKPPGHRALTGDVSEIAFDTVATTIVDGVLYVAYNYKVRYMVTQDLERSHAEESVAWREGKIDYRSFGDVRQAGLSNAMVALKQELSEKENEAENPIKQVVFVGVDKGKFNDKYLETLRSLEPELLLNKDPEAQDISAAPHAEMQLVSHLMTAKKGVVFKDLYFGVSKECCGFCAEYLTKLGAKFRAQAKPKVKNWLTPEHIPTLEVYRAVV